MCDFCANCGERVNAGFCHMHDVAGFPYGSQCPVYKASETLLFERAMFLIAGAVPAVTDDHWGELEVLVEAKTSDDPIYLAHVILKIDID
jgi:hypothetical protein